MFSRLSSRILSSAFLIAFLATALLSSAHAASGLVVNEIMYDTPGTNGGHQWIEVTNAGTEPVDLSAKDVRFFDKKGSHVINAYGTTPPILSPGEVAIIADKPGIFLTDNPNFSGALFDSVVSLTADDTIGFKTTDGDLLTRASYTSSFGAKGDGDSLHNSGSAFIAGAPNPGVEGTPPSTAKPIRVLNSKPSAVIASTNKSTAHAPADTSSSDSHPSSYDKGINAPTAKTPSSAVGAAVASSASEPFFQYLISSIWFAAFLALLAVSGISLVALYRTRSHNASH